MKSCLKVAANFKMDQLYCLTWQESHKREKLWNVHFVTLTTYLLTPANVYLITVPTIGCLFFSRRILFLFFHSMKPQALTPVFIIGNTGSFWIQLDLSARVGSFAHLGLHREESPAGFIRSLIIVVNKHFSGSLPHKLQQPPQKNAEFNDAFPSLWFYSHICQLRHLICRIVYYFLSNIQPLGRLKLTWQSFCSTDGSYFDLELSTILNFHMAQTVSLVYEYVWLVVAKDHLEPCRVYAIVVWMSVKCSVKNSLFAVTCGKIYIGQRGKEKIITADLDLAGFIFEQ